MPEDMKQAGKRIDYFITEIKKVNAMTPEQLASAKKMATDNKQKLEKAQVDAEKDEEASMSGGEAGSSPKVEKKEPKEEKKPVAKEPKHAEKKKPEPKK